MLRSPETRTTPHWRAVARMGKAGIAVQAHRTRQPALSVLELLVSWNAQNRQSAAMHPATGAHDHCQILPDCNALARTSLHGEIGRFRCGRDHISSLTATVYDLTNLRWTMSRT